MGEETCTLFEVLTPLGFTVQTTVKYWLLIETKHPKLRGRAAVGHRRLSVSLAILIKSARADKTPLSTCSTVRTSLASYAL